jgi:hypothetical protein
MFLKFFLMFWHFFYEMHTFYATSKDVIIDGFRGKIGPIVGSRNKSGNIIRKRTKPTNPNTQAMQTARLGMRTAGKIYATLTLEQQGGWLTFAQKIYNPLKGKNTGQYTAAQACTAVAAMLNNFNGHVKAPSIELYGGTTPITGVTTKSLPNITDPPIDSVAPNILDATPNAASLKLDGIYFDSSNHLTIDLTLLGLSGSGLAQTEMVDSKGHTLGFGVYLSTPVNFVGARPSNQLSMLLCDTGIIDVGTVGIITAHGFRMIIDASSFLVGHKHLPSTGQVFLATLIVYGDNGTASLVNSFYSTYGTAAPTLPS